MELADKLRANLTQIAKGAEKRALDDADTTYDTLERHKLKVLSAFGEGSIVVTTEHQIRAALEGALALAQTAVTARDYSKKQCARNRLNEFVEEMIDSPIERVFLPEAKATPAAGGHRTSVAAGRARPAQADR